MDQFRYDPLGQIVEHVDPQGKLKRFFHDPAGDRLTTGVKQAEGPWRREGWCEGVHYRFDAAGNLVERRDERDLETAQAAEAPKTLALAWDANQRLVRSRARPTFGGVEAETVETVYGYDPLGRRVFKRTNDQTTRFGWDGDSLVAEGSTESWREYLYYPGGFVPLALVDGKNSYRYHTDRNGCPTRLTKDDGQVVWAARSEAWGRANVLINRLDNPIRLQGQYEDRETGLHYNLCRYFDPISGSFISPDLLKLAAGLNLYKFAPNALVWIDPLGLSPLDIGQVGKHGHPINSRVEYGDNISYLVEGSKPSTKGRLVGWHYYENPGHHDPNRNAPLRGAVDYNPNKSVLPANHVELFQGSVFFEGNRWAKDSDGNFHQFQDSGDFHFHWAGSTNGETKKGKKLGKVVDQKVKALFAGCG
ncbi:RHS repeat domain-containing protein [Roseateles sp. UC29_93]|uniref:RHS repeat domain-containing protein n=1 Tax=Roseateles sp. UC29_93 TaxID=3350177 RepID=UPI0036734A60